jgi:hypothetical protein
MNTVPQRLDLIAFQNTEGEWQSECRNTFVEILDDENNVLPVKKVASWLLHCSIKHTLSYATTLATLGF